MRQIAARIIKAINPIAKSATPNQVVTVASAAGDDFITHPTDLRGYKTLVSNSTILPQCIRAYKNNIAGFGIGVRYKHDEEENPEMKAEWDKISEILELLNLDQNTKEIFEDIIEAREIYGIAYLEVIRNLKNEVVGIEFIRQTDTIHKTAPLDPFIEVEYTVRGNNNSKDRIEKRPKRFCKYRQMYNGKTVYFKEIGDPRVMDRRDGKYGEGIPLEYQANEILEFALGVEAYGEVRWIGQIMGADGSRRAETLNNRYFTEGRHTPMMIMVNGGTLTDDSFNKLQQYVDGIKGESGQHAFIVLESAETVGKTAIDGDIPPSVQIHNMASMLQKDELFQDYMDNHRRKVQSAFQLPDLYVGYTTDFNRATAISAQQTTEQQVFQPERVSLAWAVNNKLLAGYNFKHVEAFFMEPEITNIDDMQKLLNIAVRAGGVTPNKAKELTYMAMGGVAEEFPEEWGNIPLEVRKLSMSAKYGMGVVDDVPNIPDDELLDEQLKLQIKKAVEHRDDDIAAVLKEVRNLLRGNSEEIFAFWGECDIIKGLKCRAKDPANCNHPNCPGGGGKTYFAEAIEKAKATIEPERAWRVDASPPDYYANCKRIVTPGGSTAAIKPNGDIISVCRVASDTAISGSELLQEAVKLGGNRLDAFSGLYNFYIKNGFEPVSWTPFNEEFAPPGWKESGTKPEHIIFYRYTGKAFGMSRDDFLDNTPPFTNYDDAMAERDRRVV